MKPSSNIQQVLNWTDLWLFSTYSRRGMKSQATPGLLSTHVLQALMSLLATNCVCLEVRLSFSVFTWSTCT